MNGVYSWCYGVVSVRKTISRLLSNIGYQIKMGDLWGMELTNTISHQ